MKYNGVVAALALLAAMSVSGIRAQAQQEVDPTNYPLTSSVTKPANRPAPHSVKQSPTHNPQRATVKKTQKSSTGSAHHATIKTVSKR
jgi:hypothetical protein